MRKAAYILAVIIIAITIAVSLQPKNQTSTAYHVTLADPKLYNNGTFTDNFKIQKGTYQFSFVPNGDSPQNLSISLKGNFSYNEDFSLQGTLHNTGISSYYTWDYLSSKTIEIPQDQEIQIKINPHGNVLGSVSVDLNRK
ncbi:MAG: hypothetical protein HY222_05465 [Thaumarchaeota archaeon]|nr:hypothetical protein [Nitrososphaerota archaeon]MBI3641825.1 hypothetical protein [Nitrososphaerota archaeon]